MSSAAERWATDLAAWAIPQSILDAAPESPWGYPVELFARKVDEAAADPSPSARAALDALPAGGTVLDIGCGAGAGAMPLAGPASTVIGVDSSASMLAAFRERAAARGVEAQTIEGEWPRVASATPCADVAVCHHVVYNVQDLVPFVQRLTDHARRRVVVELHAEHPTSHLNDLWLQFHTIRRPAGPTADDAEAVLREMGLLPERQDWTMPGLSWVGPDAHAQMIAWVRRRICLTADRDPHIAAAMNARIIREANGAVRLPDRHVVTLWWDGTAK